jgi:dihydropteroate synthase
MPTPPTAPAIPAWRLSRGRCLTFEQPRLMAILNLTPDSFSDGGALASVEAAVERARECIDQGADMLDVGGESTRPGAERVPAAEQIRRVIPVIAGIRAAGIETPISVDTTLSEVARSALDAGADAINDVSAGSEDPQVFHIASTRGAGLVLMHRLRPPDEDVYSHEYRRAPIAGDIGAVVRTGLKERMQAAVKAGVEMEAIALDPGLGFGKTVPQNLDLMRQPGRVAVLGRPLLWGPSRKSFLGALAGVDTPAARDAVSVAAAVLMHQVGVRFFRVHDVAVHRQALAVATAFAAK